MEDRKTRISKLSERFKPHTDQPTKPARQRERRSFYLAGDVIKRIDQQHKELNHQTYPRTVSKSLFLEAVLEYGLNNLAEVKTLLEGKEEDEASPLE
jgi:hypothetical protein